MGTLSLAGLKAGACVSATAKDALARGYTVELNADAIACDSDASRRRSLRALQSRGARLSKAPDVRPPRILAPPTSPATVQGWTVSST